MNILLPSHQMRRLSLWFAVTLMAWRAAAGERVIDFSKFPVDQTPPGFKSILSGSGTPGDWRIVPDSDPQRSENGPSSEGSVTTNVLAQLSTDKTDERFPILLYDAESYADFSLTTRFKIVSGDAEQMAGIAFRVQDTNNYYYVRASAGGNTFRFIKLVNGQRLTTIGPSVAIERGVWHQLQLECKGNRISCLLDGKEIIPPLNDNTFTTGKIGFWTKSDSVSYFGETRISFTPHEILAQVLVREALRKYPRLVGLRLYAHQGDLNVPKVVASSHEDELGMAGGTVEQDVISRDVMYYGKQQKVAVVTLPVHDRNGEVAGAVRVVLQSFPGQTEQNALVRAQPVVKEMESRIRTAKDLLQ